MKRLIMAAALCASACFVTPAVRAQYTSTLNPSTTWGTWEGWGCSLAWWGRVWGTNTTLSEIVFTTNYVSWNGTNIPGLGMNIARYNVGACSSNSYSGASMNAPDIPWYRQVDAYWTNWASSDPSSSSWRWNADPNQRAALLNAQTNGANIFELFDNSPVWWMCYDHDPAGETNGADDNLQSWNYDSDAVYLATVAEYFKTNWGITFNSVEALNEPSSDWWDYDNNQEGCHFAIGTQESVIGYLRTELNNRGLNSTTISASDENTYDIATNTWNSFNSTTRSDVGRINVHGYEYGGGRRDILYDQAQAAGKDLWDSEYGDSDTSGMSLMSNLNLDFRWLHNTAWVYWQPFDQSGWGLINCSLPNFPTTVNYKYYVLAQYTRHIRQGMTMIDGGNGNVIAAYDSANNKVIIVCSNYGTAQYITFSLANFSSVGGPVTRWETQTYGNGNLYNEYTNDTVLHGTEFWSWFPTNTIQTFEIQNVTE
jgi:galactan endo-1,6-beta-galactosidase